MQTDLFTELKHRGPLKLAAKALLEDNPTGNIIVYKVPRAGATTGLTAASADRNEPIVVVAPTNEISTKTVLEETVKYMENPGKVLVRCPPNKECIKNQELIGEYPDIEELDMLPIGGEDGGGCKGCGYYDECPLTEVLRKPWDVCALTYHKVYALEMSAEFAKYMKKDKEGGPSTAEQIRNKITSLPVNLLLDECHLLQYPDTKEITIALKNKDGIVRRGLQQYCRITGDDFPHLASLIKKIQRILDHKDVKKATKKLIRAHEKRKIGAEKESIEIKNIWEEEGEYVEVGSEEDVGFVIDIIKETIKLMKVRKEFGLSAKEVADLQWLYFLATSESIHIQASRVGETITVSAVAINHDFPQMIRNFITEVQNNRKHKRTILTSATVGSWDYGQLFPRRAKFKDVFFGRGGDPGNTAEKQHIFTDNWKLSAHGKYCQRSRLPVIMQGIKKISAFFGNTERIIVVAMSKGRAEMLNREIRKVPELDGMELTYYKSPGTIGVKGNYRVMILVGIAEKPVNSFDAITSTKEESLKMREEAVNADTYQALSRCKDPIGKEDSYVFVLGSREEDVKKCIIWGTRRRLIPTDERGRRFEVEIGKPLPTPKLFGCNGVDEMLDGVKKEFITGGVYFNCSKVRGKLSLETLSSEDAETVKNYTNNLQEIKSTYIYHIGTFSELKEIYDTPKSQKHCAEAFAKSALPKVQNILLPSYNIKNVQIQDVENSKNLILQKSPENLPVQNQNINHIPKDVHLKDEVRRAPLLTLVNKPSVVVPSDDVGHLYFDNIDIPIVKDVLHGKYELCLRIAHNRERYLETNYLGGWFANSATLSDSLIRAHAEGREVIGVYPIRDDGTVSFICFDIDGHPGIDNALKNLKRKHHKEIKKIEIKEKEWVESVMNAMELEPISYDLRFDMAAAIRKQCGEENRESIFRYEAAKKELEEKHNDREASYAAAEAETKKLCSFLDQYKIPYLLEASGSPHSYHVWLFLIPTETARAKAFGYFINKKAGTNIVEINPKNDRSDSQNAIKLPFADYSCKKRAPDKVRAKKSMIRYKGKWVSDIREIEIQQLDISNFPCGKPFKSVKPTKSSCRGTGQAVEEDGEHEHVGTYAVRPFFKWAIHQQLEGYQGNRCRVAVVREYYCAGMEDSDELAGLFKHQNDYDHEESLRQVQSLLKKDFGPWKEETMYAEFGSILACFHEGKDFEYQNHEFSQAPDIACPDGVG